MSGFRWVRWGVLAGCSALLLLLLVGPVQANGLNPAVGTLLVARDGLPDPRFNKSVILIIQQDEQGTGGLVVNRPSRLSLADLLGRQPLFAERLEGTLSYGGPVASQSLLVLARLETRAPQASSQLFENLYVTGIPELVSWLDQGVEALNYRVFTGYTGWTPGQLAGELARGDWRVLPADAESLFAESVGHLWEQLSKQRVL